MLSTCQVYSSPELLEELDLLTDTPGPAIMTRYGREFPLGTSLLDIELVAYRFGFDVETGGLGKAAHFKRIVQHLWGKDSRKQFIWHPWADDMNEEACRHHYLGVSGSGSSGKTDFFAVKGIVDYICAPQNTLVLMTSTSLKEARKRIWGACLDYWSAVPGLPGKVIDSMGLIRLQTGDGKAKEKFSDRCGISLIAAEKKQEREAIGKLIGLKQQRLIFIGDEMPELSEAILEACYTNLSLNPEFWLFALGNFKSIYDPFGQFTKPKGGWGSITVDDREWETERGLCLHFDALQSPNWIAGENKWPIIKVESIQAAIDHEGMESPGFWRMFRSFPCPGGSEQGIYSEADIIKFKAEEIPIWEGGKIRVAGLDPSFTLGGDRAPLVFGWYGRDSLGRMVICADKEVVLSADVTKKEEPFSYQIARQFRDVCEAEGCLPENAAYDRTGAGGPFGDIVAEEWSPKVLGVQFGGKASELPFSALASEPAVNKCANRVSELWWIGLEFLRNRQLKGIFPSLAREMCARQYETEKGGQLRLKVESKEDMRSRIGKSPDTADAFFIMIDLCRTRHGAVPGGEGGFRQARDKTKSWAALARRLTPRAKSLRLQ